MKVAPQRDFPVSIRRGDDDCEPEEVPFCIDTYELALNTTVRIGVVPEFDLADLDVDRIVDQVLTSSSQARASVVSWIYGVTPNDELAGRDEVVPIKGSEDLRAGESAGRSSLRSNASVLFYVGHAEFDQLMADLAVLYEDDGMYERFGKPLSQVADGPVRRFLVERFVTSPLVDEPLLMLGK